VRLSIFSSADLGSSSRQGFRHVPFLLIDLPTSVTCPYSVPFFSFVPRMVLFGSHIFPVSFRLLILSTLVLFKILLNKGNFIWKPTGELDKYLWKLKMFGGWGGRKGDLNVHFMFPQFLLPVSRCFYSEWWILQNCCSLYTFTNLSIIKHQQMHLRMIKMFIYS
jgi:hypothetical protein